MSNEEIKELKVRGFEIQNEINMYNRRIEQLVGELNGIYDKLNNLKNGNGSEKKGKKMEVL